jgi:hypothetical protein
VREFKAGPWMRRWEARRYGSGRWSLRAKYCRRSCEQPRQRRRSASAGAPSSPSLLKFPTPLLASDRPPSGQQQPLPRRGLSILPFLAAPAWFSHVAPLLVDVQTRGRGERCAIQKGQRLARSASKLMRFGLFPLRGGGRCRKEARGAEVGCRYSLR